MVFDCERFFVTRIIFLSFLLLFQENCLAASDLRYNALDKEFIDAYCDRSCLRAVCCLMRPLNVENVSNHTITCCGITQTRFQSIIDSICCMPRCLGICVCSSCIALDCYCYTQQYLRKQLSDQANHSHVDFKKINQSDIVMKSEDEIRAHKVVDFELSLQRIEDLKDQDYSMVTFDEYLKQEKNKK